MQYSTVQYSTVQYSTGVIIYDNSLHPLLFTSDPCLVITREVYLRLNKNMNAHHRLQIQISP